MKSRNRYGHLRFLKRGYGGSSFLGTSGELNIGLTFLPGPSLTIEKNGVGVEWYVRFIYGAGIGMEVNRRI